METDVLVRERYATYSHDDNALTLVCKDGPSEASHSETML